MVHRALAAMLASTMSIAILAAVNEVRIYRTHVYIPFATRDRIFEILQKERKKKNIHFSGRAWKN